MKRARNPPTGVETRGTSSAQVWAGSPAKMLRKLEEEEAGFIAQAANDYAALAAVHAIENGKTMEEILVRPPLLNACST